MSEPSRARLLTEQGNAASARLDELSIEAAIDLIQREDLSVNRALYAVREPLARAVQVCSERLARGGRLFYVGAGTSGRLGLLDAVECPPTFQSAPEQVQAILAGGLAAVERSVEGAEDDRAAAGVELARRSLGERDVVLGITAGGTTPFVHGAIEYARSLGAATLFLACVPFEEAPDRADVSMRVLVGPEILAGSTRLKAGTATKLVLNTLSTLVMVQLGKVHGNLMVDVDTRGNAKLVERGTRIVAELTGLAHSDARVLLDRAGGQAKLAVVMHARSVDRREADRLLAAAGGRLRRVLEAPRH